MLLKWIKRCYRCWYISNSAAKIAFIALKAEADRLNISKLVNVTTGLNNLKTLVDGLDVGKLKNVPIDKKKENSWWNYFNLHESIENR